MVVHLKCKNIDFIIIIKSHFSDIITNYRHFTPYYLLEEEKFSGNNSQNGWRWWYGMAGESERV